MNVLAACPCGFVSAASPSSPEWHRGHRDHHMMRYPDANVDTRSALDYLVRLAESGCLAPPDSMKPNRAERGPTADGAAAQAAEAPTENLRRERGGGNPSSASSPDDRAPQLAPARQPTEDARAGAPSNFDPRTRHTIPVCTRERPDTSDVTTGVTPYARMLFLSGRARLGRA